MNRCVKKTSTLIVLLVMVLMMLTVCYKLIMESESGKSQTDRSIFADYIWTGKDCTGKRCLMIVASSAGESKGLRLTIYEIQNISPRQNIKTYELEGPRAAVVVSLRVHRDTRNRCLYAAVRWAKAEMTADWVVRIDERPKALFDGINRGKPSFQVRNGKALIREVWDIDELMATGWKPGKTWQSMCW